MADLTSNKRGRRASLPLVKLLHDGDAIRRHRSIWSIYDEFQPVDKEIIDKVIKPFNIKKIGVK